MPEDNSKEVIDMQMVERMKLIRNRMDLIGRRKRPVWSPTKELQLKLAVLCIKMAQGMYKRLQLKIPQEQGRQGQGQLWCPKRLPQFPPRQFTIHLWPQPAATHLSQRMKFIKSLFQKDRYHPLLLPIHNLLYHLSNTIINNLQIRMRNSWPKV